MDLIGTTRDRADGSNGGVQHDAVSGSHPKPPEMVGQLLSGVHPPEL